MTSQEEIWKPIPDYEGYYEASTKGQIRSLTREITYKNGKKQLHKGKILKPGLNNAGYLCVVLQNKKRTTRTVHQLIAITFLNHIPNGYITVVDHKNSNKLDNNVNNLQLISQRANTTKINTQGTSKYTGVHWDKSKTKWVSRIYIQGKQRHLGTFNCELAAAHAYTTARKEVNCD